MDNPFVHKIIQLIIIMVLLWTVISGQENGNAFMNDTAIENASLNNTNQTISNLNNTIMNSTEFASRDDGVFIIGSNVKTMPLGIVNINDSSKILVQPPKRAIFLIKGYAKPTKDDIFKDPYLLNAAYLSRKVEGTPHGQVSYFN